nr:hypothetical protein [bacterium]
RDESAVVGPAPSARLSGSGRVPGAVGLWRWSAVPSGRLSGLAGRSGDVWRGGRGGGSRGQRAGAARPMVDF